MYYGSFTNEGDVLREFAVKDFKGVIIFAVYDQDSYEGSADVIFVEDGKFYLAHGSHCSCYGLEECWDPVEMPIQGLRRIIEEGYGPIRQYAAQIETALGFVEELGLEGIPDEQVQMAIKLLYG